MHPPLNLVNMPENTQRDATEPDGQPLLWDVFCRVIDNHGDLGVLWRLSCQLAMRGHSVRLWVDDATALAWMAPAGHPRVHVIPWSDSEQTDKLAVLPKSDVWIEGFGCNIEQKFIAHYLITERDNDDYYLNYPAWINLEYLTAESYAERCHGLPSPILHGPAAGQVKRFFYPGFTPATGGLLREPDLMARQQHFDRVSWLHEQGIPWSGEHLISLFCYEPAYLAAWLRALADAPTPTRLLVTHGRAAHAVAAACQHLGWAAHSHGNVRLQQLPALTQMDYDHLLWACDMNAVRGEDSLVRALWARKPFIWHIYPQEDGAHHDKLAAFLDWADAPGDIRQLHRWWNSDTQAQPVSPTTAPPTITLPTLPDWHAATRWAQQLADRLLRQPDLVTQLLAAVMHRGDVPR